MAATGKTAEVLAPGSGAKVPVTIPKGTVNDEANVFVGVGGKNYLLPRGKTSYVPWYVAEELRRSERAKEKLEAEVEKRTAAAGQ